MTNYSPLVNENSNIVIKSKKVNLILFLITFLLLLQIFCVVYMIILARIANGIDLFNLNTTETNQYIDKIKIIIDKICANYITCK